VQTQAGCGAVERAQGAEERPGVERVSEAESGARKGTTLTYGAIGSARAERERERSTAGLGRGKRTAQEGGGEGKGAGACGPLGQGRGRWAGRARRKERAGPRGKKPA
jgi:hypothetical protein